MWRYLSRGFLQGFKKNLDEKPYSHIKGGHDIQQNYCFVELLPCAFKKLSISDCREKRQNRKEYRENCSGNVGHHSFLEAFGWSGALVFGWAISKQIWLRHIWNQEQSKKNKRVLYANGATNFLSFIVKTQPPIRYVLPQKQSPHEKPLQESELEDEFESAAKELLEIHNQAVGQALNRKGIACLSKSTGSEAVKYFQKASELKYSPASFNMGQCCELGIGTEQDFQQAAKWYKIASDQGHASAMYNLGVFYAHGWGGLNADIETARQLFLKAAQLGQPDAKAALEKEYKFNSNNIYESSYSTAHFKNCSESKVPELNMGFVKNVLNEHRDTIFQNKGFATERKWDVPLTITLN